MCNFRITRYQCGHNTDYLRVGSPCREAIANGPSHEFGQYATCTETTKETCCTEECCVAVLEAALDRHFGDLLDNKNAKGLQKFKGVRGGLTAKHESVCKPQQAQDHDHARMLQSCEDKRKQGEAAAPKTTPKLQTLGQRNAQEDAMLTPLKSDTISKAARLNHAKVEQRMVIEELQMDLKIAKKDARMEEEMAQLADQVRAGALQQQAERQAAHARQNACLKYMRKTVSKYD